MPRLVPYLGIVAALLVSVFYCCLNKTTTSYIPAVFISAPTSTPSITNAATTTPVRSSAIKKIIPKKITPPTPVSKPVSSATSSISVPLDISASTLRAALINIVCYAPMGGTLSSISGSGVIIDPKGIILTNAHVAQYFLLADRGVSCSIRSGSPATTHYNASVIYISPTWLHANTKVLTETTPNGTGEYDFALLAISKSATSDSLPAVFPFVTLAKVSPIAGASTVIASYGAQFLDSNQITSNLFPTVVFGSVKDVFTFKANTIDVLALGGSVAAQEGSSGGGVVNGSGDLVGTITTSTVSGATNTRSLDAITASYIRTEYASETGQALDTLLSEPTATSIANFAPQIPALESIITAQLH